MQHLNNKRLVSFMNVQDLISLNLDQYKILSFCIFCCDDIPVISEELVIPAGSLAHIWMQY